MEKVAIIVKVPHHIALREGRCEFGESEIRPTDEQLGALEPFMRDWLSRVLDKSGLLAATPGAVPRIIDVCRVTWEEVVKWLRESHAAYVEESAKLAAEREAKIADWLGKPDEAWFSSCERENRDRKRKPACVRRTYWRFDADLDALKGDDRIEARIADLEPELTWRQQQADAEFMDLEADLVAHYKAEAERKDAEEEVFKQRKIEVEKAFRAWAAAQSDVPALYRAAHEGYDIADGVVDAVAKRIQVAFSDRKACVLREGGETYKACDWDERFTPSPEAFQVYDLVVEAAKALDKPEGLEVEVAKMASFDWGDKTEYFGKDVRPPFTAVIVRVNSCITKELFVVIRAEPEED